MRVLIICAAAACFALTASAQNSFSFTGTFTTDDQLEFFSFVAGGTAPTLLSLGYAGGTNHASTVIPAGGFDSFFSLFDASGNLIATDDDSRPVSDPATGNAFDADLASVGGLTSGATYKLVLSQSPNEPTDTLLADGFFDPSGGSTCNYFFTGTGSFCDASEQRNGKWAVDILNVQSASDVTVSTPEPGTIALFGLGLGALVLARRRRV